MLGPFPDTVKFREVPLTALVVTVLTVCGAGLHAEYRGDGRVCGHHGGGQLAGPEHPRVRGLNRTPAGRAENTSTTGN